MRASRRRSSLSPVRTASRRSSWSVWVIATISDVRPVIEGSAAERIAERYFGEIPELIPAGAFPASWIRLRD